MILEDKPTSGHVLGAEDFNILSKEKNMGNKLYVGGLPYSVTEARLQEIFAAHGTVESAKVITDKFTGQSRGFGFVEMGSGGEAQRAMQALNGTDMDGRTLVVNEAKPMERRDGGGGGRGDRSGGRNRW
jgi:RNA recognition motif-containing protein